MLPQRFLPAYTCRCRPLKAVVVVAARVAVEKAVAVAMSVVVENPEEVVGKGTQADD